MGSCPSHSNTRTAVIYRRGAQARTWTWSSKVLVLRSTRCAVRSGPEGGKLPCCIGQRGEAFHATFIVHCGPVTASVSVFRAITSRFNPLRATCSSLAVSASRLSGP